MSLGVESPVFCCCFCKRNVTLFDAVFVDGQSFHEHCYRMSLARDLSHLDKKKQLGTITLAEANLEKEIIYKLDLARNGKTIPPDGVVKKDPYRFCQKPGFGFLDSSNVRLFTSGDGKYKSGHYIKLPFMRITSCRSIQEAKFKELEASRSLRWAWESFNLLDGGLLLLNSQDTKQLIEENKS